VKHDISFQKPDVLMMSTRSALSAPVKIYMESEVFPVLTDNYRAFQTAYRAQDWGEASKILENYRETD